MRPEERKSVRTVFAASGALMVLALVVGVLLVVSGGPSRQTSTIVQAAPGAEGATTPSPTPTAPAKPEPAKRRCWDGTVVQGEHRCSVDAQDAQFWAFGLDRSNCRPGRRSSHARWSYECTVRGVDVHVATYNADARSSRLREYGARQDLGNSRVLTGGPDAASGRWLRTYDDVAAARGLLMYASVDGADPYYRQVLLSLRQRFAEKLLMGEPVVTDSD